MTHHEIVADAVKRFEAAGCPANIIPITFTAGIESLSAAMQRKVDERIARELASPRRRVCVVRVAVTIEVYEGTP